MPVKIEKKKPKLCIICGKNLPPKAICDYHLKCISSDKVEEKNKCKIIITDEKEECFVYI